jgi:putative ATPase
VQQSLGATTENPSFEVNAALLSRATVYVLQPLTAEELKKIVDLALDNKEIKAIDIEAIDALVAYADGDARRLINTLETLNVAAQQQHLARMTAAWVLQMLGERVRRFDKGGDALYDSISALHKSVRGSDPDAALYWLRCMLEAGADPRYVARRLIRMASEDIGLADPRALRLSLDAAEVYERLGSPEGELALAQCAVYLAVAPKSNAVYTAYQACTAFVKQTGSKPVPLRLRNAPTALMKQLHHGEAYRYAHDEPDAFAAGERYFPDDLPDQRFYEPVPRGLEIKIGDKLRELRIRNDKKN